MRSGTVSSLVMRTEGQRMLLAVTGSLAAIAGEIGGKPQTVHAWKTGAKLPSAQARTRMQEAFGIPAKAWTVRPGGTGGALESTEEQPPVDAAALPSTMEHCLSLLVVIQRLRNQPGLMPSELNKLIDTESRLLQQRARFEEIAKFAEARYVSEHPAWIRLKRVILKALEPHPLAAKAVAEAIEQEASR